MQRLPFRNVHDRAGLRIFRRARFALPGGKAAKTANLHASVFDQSLADRFKEYIYSHIHILLLQGEFCTYLIYKVFFQHMHF